MARFFVLCSVEITTVSSMDHAPDRPSAHQLADAPEYLSRQLITCLGNKRALLAPISAALGDIEGRLGRDHLRILDAFSGSGVVSRLFKRHASLLVTNDLEPYSATIARCFLANRSEVDAREIDAAVECVNASVPDWDAAPGFIERLYAPRDESAINLSERVFYTRENARRLDGYRSTIGALPEHLHDLLLGPLLSAASIHANTAGVFKGFYKDRTTGIGEFGGTGRNSLGRIRGLITLETPVLSRFECAVEVHRRDANELAGAIGDLDVAYLDPPYNQHPYGSNYFMLNLLTTYEEPGSLSRVSGIPTDWNRSQYNMRDRALAALTGLVATLDARFILLSYNDEGFVAPDAVSTLLQEFGEVSEVRTRYNAFRGSRNLRDRDTHVTEHLFVLEKSPANR